MLSEILKLMPLIIFHEWVYQGYVKLKFAALTKRVQQEIFFSQIKFSLPLSLWFYFENYYNFFQWNQRLFCQLIVKHHKCAKSSFVILVGQCKGRSPVKKCFLLDFFLMRGGRALPIILVHFQEVHFWSIKEPISSKMPIIWTKQKKSSIFSEDRP